MRHHHRLDANHGAILETAEACGWLCLDTSQTGLGLDVILVKAGRVVFAEVKDGSKPPSRQGLTIHEVAVHQRLKLHGIHVELLTCVDDVLALERPLRGMYDLAGRLMDGDS